MIQPNTTKLTPQIAGDFIALVSQVGTAAPTAIVIKNTLPPTATLEWGRANAGIYTLIASESGYFPTEQVTCTIQDNVMANKSIIGQSNTSQITIATAINSTGTFTDGLMANMYVRITIWDRKEP